MNDVIGTRQLFCVSKVYLTHVILLTCILFANDLLGYDGNKTIMMTKMVSEHANLRYPSLTRM